VKRIGIIGLGTLGGSLCKNIAEMEVVDEIVVVDFDTIESRNIHNSIYDISQIDEFKTSAIKRILSKFVDVIPITTKYIEGQTKLPSCDLLIDCRDVVCNRDNEIDVRLYITGKKLVIDCRKNYHTENDYDGSYTMMLSRSELNKAGFFAAQIVCSNQIYDMIRNNNVQVVNLNLLPEIIDEAVKKSIENRVDMIYEMSDEMNRLQCIEENISPIIELNKRRDIPVLLESRSYQDKPDYIIPKKTLSCSFDIVQKLSEIINFQDCSSNFIVVLGKKKNGTMFIELLEETGAA